MTTILTTLAVETETRRMALTIVGRHVVVLMVALVGKLVPSGNAAEDLRQ